MTARYRLMVRQPDGYVGSWVKVTDDGVVPLRSKNQALQRRAEVMASHPDCRAWIERIYLGPGWREWNRLRKALRRFR